MVEKIEIKQQYSICTFYEFLVDIKNLNHDIHEENLVFVSLLAIVRFIVEIKMSLISC